MIAMDRDNELRTLSWGLHAAGLLVLLAGGATAQYVVFRPLSAREKACVSRCDEWANELRNIDSIRQQHKSLNESLANIERDDDRALLR